MATKAQLEIRVARLEAAIRALVGSASQPGAQAQAMAVADEDWGQ